MSLVLFTQTGAEDCAAILVLISRQPAAAGKKKQQRKNQVGPEDQEEDQEDEGVGMRRGRPAAAALAKWRSVAEALLLRAGQPLQADLSGTY